MRKSNRLVPFVALDLFGLLLILGAFGTFPYCIGYSLPFVNTCIGYQLNFNLVFGFLAILLGLIFYLRGRRVRR